MPLFRHKNTKNPQINSTRHSENGGDGSDGKDVSMRQFFVFWRNNVPAECCLIGKYFLNLRYHWALRLVRTYFHESVFVSPSKKMWKFSMQEDSTNSTYLINNNFAYEALRIVWSAHFRHIWKSVSFCSWLLKLRHFHVIHRIRVDAHVYSVGITLFGLQAVEGLNSEHRISPRFFCVDTLSGVCKIK